MTGRKGKARMATTEAARGTRRVVTTVTPSVVARLTGAKTETVLRWIRKGRLPAFNIGTAERPYFRIFRKDLRRCLVEMGVAPEDAAELVKF